jgi:hypothetical protein
MPFSSLYTAPRRMLRECLLRHVCEKLNNKLKYHVRNVVTIGEEASTAIMATGAYSYIKTVINTTENTRDNTIVSVFKKINSIFSEDTVPATPPNVVAIPTPTFTTLVLLAALTVSATDMALRNIAENKRPRKRGILARAKSLGRAAFIKPFQKPKIEPKGSMVVGIQAITKYNTMKAKQLKDCLKKEAIRTIPCIALSGLLALSLGFAAVDGAALYVLYRSAIKVKKVVIDYADFPAAPDTTAKNPPGVTFSKKQPAEEKKGLGSAASHRRETSLAEDAEDSEEA